MNLLCIRRIKKTAYTTAISVFQHGSEIGKSLSLCFKKMTRCPSQSLRPLFSLAKLLDSRNFSANVSKHIIAAFQIFRFKTKRQKMLFAVLRRAGSPCRSFRRSAGRVRALNLLKFSARERGAIPTKLLAGEFCVEKRFRFFAYNVTSQMPPRQAIS